MRVILFGGSGMVGQGVLRECLRDPDVTEVLSVVRAPTGQHDPKLHELVHADFFDFAPLATRFSGYDACFFCLGVTSAGKTEAQYTRVTYDITMAVATVLAAANPRMTFVFVSGAGSDSSEHGRVMWARVKGRAENGVLGLPFKGYVFRPALIQPLHGVKSRTAAYRLFYSLTRPLLPLLSLVPGYATTTEQIGRAMLAVARAGAPVRVLHSADINKL